MGRLRKTRSAGTSSSEREPKKRLVSFDVFMKYVATSTSGEIDVSRVFSKDCFQEWVDNRKRHPKEPEESFRKALVAHVSGKDDRKPFSEQVEEKILKRLRESSPWPCFADSPEGANKIGERGLKKSSLGYHESRKGVPNGGGTTANKGRNKNQAKRFKPGNASAARSATRKALGVTAAQPYPSNDPQVAIYSSQFGDPNIVQYEIPTYTKQMVGCKVEPEFNPVYFPESSQTSYDDLDNVWDSTKFPGFNLGDVSLSIPDDNSFSKASLDPNDDTDFLWDVFPSINPESKNNPEEDIHAFVSQVLRKSCQPNLEMSSLYARNLASFYTVNELLRLFELNQRDGIQLFNDDICRKLDGIERTSPIEHQRSFILPSQMECSFNLSKPIGNITVSPDGEILFADNKATMILQRKLEGTNYFALYNGNVHRCLCLFLSLEGLLSPRGEVWTKVFAVGEKGEKRVLLMRQTLLPGRQLQCMFQALN